MRKRKYLASFLRMQPGGPKLPPRQKASFLDTQSKPVDFTCNKTHGVLILFDWCRGSLPNLRNMANMSKPSRVGRVPQRSRPPCDK